MKTALKGRLAGERAPQALRDRVEKLLGIAGDDDHSGNGALPINLSATRRFRIWGMTPQRLVAAMLLLAFGLTAFLVVRGSPGQSSPTPFGNELLQAMVDTHDHCCAHDNHKHPDLDQGDFAVMKHQAAGRLNHPVVATAIDGWEFKGIYFCPVGKTRSAHLLFHRGADRLSIFTVAEAGASETTEYASTQINGRLVAAVAKNGTAFAVVAHPQHGSLTIADIEQILKRHAAQIERRAVAFRTAVDPSHELIY